MKFKLYILDFKNEEIPEYKHFISNANFSKSHLRDFKSEIIEKYNSKIFIKSIYYSLDKNGIISLGDKKINPEMIINISSHLIKETLESLSYEKGELWVNNEKTCEKLIKLIQKQDSILDDKKSENHSGIVFIFRKLIFAIINHSKSKSKKKEDKPNNVKSSPKRLESYTYSTIGKPKNPKKIILIRSR